MINQNTNGGMRMEDLANSGSSPLKLESKYSDPSSGGEEYLEFDFSGLEKNCTRRSCTKFSEAKLARQGELGARPLSAVLYESQLITPHFWLDLMLVHHTKEIPLPSFKPS